MHEEVQIMSSFGGTLITCLYLSSATDLASISGLSRARVELLLLVINTLLELDLLLAGSYKMWQTAIASQDNRVDRQAGSWADRQTRRRLLCNKNH